MKHIAHRQGPFRQLRTVTIIDGLVILLPFHFIAIHPTKDHLSSRSYRTIKTITVKDRDWQMCRINPPPCFAQLLFIYFVIIFSLLQTLSPPDLRGLETNPRMIIESN